MYYILCPAGIPCTKDSSSLGTYHHRTGHNQYHAAAVLVHQRRRFLYIIGNQVIYYPKNKYIMYCNPIKGRPRDSHRQHAQVQMLVPEIYVTTDRQTCSSQYSTAPKNLRNGVIKKVECLNYATLACISCTDKQHS